MKKQKKTYGIKGFMEYQAVIKVGNGRMKVSFTDGSMSAMGVNPATFTTDKFMVQHAIENSAEFKRGLIHIVSVIDLANEVHIERNTPAPVSPQEPLQEERPEAEEIDTEAAEQPEPEDSVDTLTQVEFASNDEAKDYLEQNFGLVRSKLRNREDICKAGKANGVEIIFV